MWSHREVGSWSEEGREVAGSRVSPLAAKLLGLQLKHRHRAHGARVVCARTRRKTAAMFRFRGLKLHARRSRDARMFGCMHVTSVVCVRLIHLCVPFAFVYVQDVPWYEYVEEDKPESEGKGAKCDTHGTVYERLTASGAYDGTPTGWEKFCNDYNTCPDTKKLVNTMSERHTGAITRNTVKLKKVTSNCGTRLTVLSQVALV